MKTCTLLISFIILFTITSCSSLQKKNTDPYYTFRASQKSFEVEGSAIKYIDEGKSDHVILLLHGVPSSSWLYRKMIPLLVSKGYRVIAPDMLGYGNSDSPKGYAIYNEENHAKRIIALMDSLHIKNWHHVMHDAGGLWTWQVFKQAPSRIKKLTVLNTIVYGEGFNPPITMQKGFFAKTAMWMYNNGITTNTMLKMLFTEGLNNPDLLSKEEVYGYKKPLLENKTKAMYYFFTQTCNSLIDYSSIFENIKIPVQFIWGKNDKMLSIALQKKLILKGFDIDENQIHLLDAKHFIQEEKPQEIVDLILDF